MLDQHGNKIGKSVNLPINVESIKASETTRSHLTGAGANNKTFDSPEEMVAEANLKYGNIRLKEVEADKELGFDINNIESIKNFKVGYTPGGQSLLVKYIVEEDKMVGKLIIPDHLNDQKKAVIVVPGLFVTNYKTGDIVALKGSSKIDPLPPSVKRIFKGVTFLEIAGEAIHGIFMEREEFIKRIEDDNKKLKELGLL